MYIDITNFFRNAAPMDYSASVAEIGASAGADTWEAACEDSNEYGMLDSHEKREAFRKYVRGFGAWDDSEIARWSMVELNALFIQLVSGDMREADMSADWTAKHWDDYYADDSLPHNISAGTDGKIFYYIGC